MKDLWIVIPNWEKFQHYGDREPTWIKVYLDLTANEDYLSLTSHCRAVLHGVWLEYARSHGHLPADTASLTRRLAVRVTKSNIESLSHAGFISIVASKPLAFTRSLEKRREDKEKNARVPAREEPSKSKKSKTDKARTWICNTAHQLDGVDLEYVLRDEFKIDNPDTVADLVAYAAERMKTP